MELRLLHSHSLLGELGQGRGLEAGLGRTRTAQGARMRPCSLNWEPHFSWGVGLRNAAESERSAFWSVDSMTWLRRPGLTFPICRMGLNPAPPTEGAVRAEGGMKVECSV